MPDIEKRIQVLANGIFLIDNAYTASEFIIHKAEDIEVVIVINKGINLADSFQGMLASNPEIIAKFLMPNQAINTPQNPVKIDSSESNNKQE